MNFIKNITGKSSHIQKTTFRLTPYSPVFVGSGNNWVKGLDFDCTNGQTVFYDLHRLFKDQIHEVEKLEHVLKNRSIRRYLKQSSLSLKNYTKLVINGQCEASELMEPVTDGNGNPIIPGSSLKGSIRSAIFAKLFEDSQLSENEYSKLIKGKKVSSRRLEQKLLTTYQRNKNGSSPNFDIGRAIRIGDISFGLENLEVFNSIIINETHKGFQWKKLGRGSKKNTQNIGDSTKVSASAISYSDDVIAEPSFTISIDKKVLKDISWDHSLDFKFIAETCNRLSKRLIDADLQYMKAAKENIPNIQTVKEDLGIIADDVDACIDEINNGNGISWIQRVGWGTGWLSKTGAHSYLPVKNSDKDYHDVLKKIAQFLFKRSKGYPFPKTRNIVLDRYGQPATTMGWVLVEMV